MISILVRGRLDQELEGPTPDFIYC